MDALAAGSDWLRLHGERAAVVPHGDADGLSAGVVLSRRARGPVVHLRSPWEDPLPGGCRS
ncbi:MAG: hypothetical protein ACM3UV_00380 [Nocardioidaceae bacterium]